MSRRGQVAMGTPAMPGCAVMVNGLSPSSLLFRVTWAGQRSSDWNGLVTSRENSQVWGLVVPVCLVGEQCIFAFAAFASWVQKGSFLTA